MTTAIGWRRRLPPPIRGRWGAVAFVVSALAVVVVLGRLRPPLGPEDIQRSPVARTGSLTVSVAGGGTVGAGDDIELTIDGAEAGVGLRAEVETGYGVEEVFITPTETTAELTIPAFVGPASGVAAVTVVQEDRVASTVLTIEPSEVAGPIDVYLGPRTVVADAAHFVMLVAVPTDSYGNPVASGTTVDFTTTRPDLRVEASQDNTENLLAWYEVFSSTRAGRTRVATESGTAAAPERTFLEVAGLPTPFALEPPGPLPPADGHALVTIATPVLADLFGNTLPDGTATVLDVQGVTGPRRIHGLTVDGRAEYTLEVPDRPGVVTLVATASGVRSLPLELAFESAVESVEGRIEYTDDATFVHVGPIRSIRGSFVPEGTAAVVTAADGTEVVASLGLGSGTAEFSPAVDLSTAVVTVLGERFEIEGPR